MAKSKSFREDLLALLKDPKEAVAYLNAALSEEDDPRVFLLALKDVTDAWGGVRKLSAQSGLNRESLYKMLSKTGNPALKSLTALLAPLGLRLVVEASPRRARAARRKVSRDKAVSHRVSVS